jgi:hypothetical protein
LLGYLLRMPCRDRLGPLMHRITPEHRCLSLRRRSLVSLGRRRLSHPKGDTEAVQLPLAPGQPLA